VQRSAVAPGASAVPVVRSTASVPGHGAAPAVRLVRRSTPIGGGVAPGQPRTTPGATGTEPLPVAAESAAPHQLVAFGGSLASVRTLAERPPLLSAAVPQQTPSAPSASRTAPPRPTTAASAPVGRLMNRAAPAATAGTTGPASAAGIPVQRLATLPGSSAARGSGTPTGPAAGFLPAPVATPLGAPAAQAYWPEAQPDATQDLATQDLATQDLAAQHLAPQHLAPVQRSTDGVRFSGVAPAEASTARSAVPSAGGSPAPGAPYTHGRALPVPLVAAAPAPHLALPVQRLPATPAVEKSGSGWGAFVSPARRAEPLVTPVVAHRSTGGGSGGSGGSGNSGSGGGGGKQPPPPYTPFAGSPPAYSPTAGHAHTGSEGAPATAGFDARKLKDEQVDELTHRLIGPLTRMLRTELRLDRERIGRLRDPRR
jgi:hypothetical protein